MSRYIRNLLNGDAQLEVSSGWMPWKQRIVRPWINTLQRTRRTSKFETSNNKENWSSVKWCEGDTKCQGMQGETRDWQIQGYIELHWLGVSEMHSVEKLWFWCEAKLEMIINPSVQVICSWQLSCGTTWELLIFCQWSRVEFFKFCIARLTTCCTYY